MKIGRNDPCPCGSGKKYKKCHLREQEAAYSASPIVMDRVTERVFSAFGRNRNQILGTRKATEGEIARRRRLLLERISGEVAELAELLEAHVCWTEQVMQGILQERSPVFWLSLGRRFPAWIHLEEVETLPGQELAVLAEMERMKTAIFFKLGSWQANDWKANPDGTLAISPKASDLVNLWGHVLPLMEEACNTPTLYRRVAKGATLTVGANGQLKAILDQDMEFLTQSYQTRRAKFSETLGKVGGLPAVCPPDVSDLAGFRDHNCAAVFFDYNADREYQPRIPSTGAKIKGPGFRPVVVFLEETFRYLEPFAQRVETLTGLTLNELRLAIVSLKNYLIDVCKGPGAYTCLSRGIVFSETKWLRDKLRSNIEEASRKEGLRLGAGRVIGRFLDLLACKRERLQAYDVFLRKGQGCLLEGNSLTLVDLTLILIVLVDMFQDLSINDTMRTIKGSRFEEFVASSLKSDLPGIEFPIAPGLHLKRKGEVTDMAKLMCTSRSVGSCLLSIAKPTQSPVAT